MMLKHLTVVVIIVILHHVTISAFEISITQAIHNKLHHLEATFRTIPDPFPGSFEKVLELSLRKLLNIDEAIGGNFTRKSACIMSFIRTQSDKNTINFLKDDTYLSFPTRNDNPMGLRRKRNVEEVEEDEESEEDEERDSEEDEEERDGEDEEEDRSEDDDEDEELVDWEEEYLDDEDSTRKNKRKGGWESNFQTSEISRQGKVVIKKVNGKVVSIQKTINKLTPTEKKALKALQNKQAKEIKNMQAMITDYINSVVNGIGEVVNGRLGNKGIYPRTGSSINNYSEKSKRFLATIKEKTKSIVKYLFNLIFNSISSLIGFDEQTSAEQMSLTKKKKKKKKKKKTKKKKHKRNSGGEKNIEGVKEKIKDKIETLDKEKIKKVIKDKLEEKTKKKRSEDDADANDEESGGGNEDE